MRKGTEKQRAYGGAWRAGDTVGALLDLDARQVRQLGCLDSLLLTSQYACWLLS